MTCAILMTLSFRRHASGCGCNRQPLPLPLPPALAQPVSAFTPRCPNACPAPPPPPPEVELFYGLEVAHGGGDTYLGARGMQC